MIDFKNLFIFYLEIYGAKHTQMVIANNLSDAKNTLNKEFSNFHICKFFTIQDIFDLYDLANDSEDFFYLFEYFSTPTNYSLRVTPQSSKFVNSFEDTIDSFILTKDEIKEIATSSFFIIENIKDDLIVSEEYRL